jgi:thiol-disulfide isomerase/thioredoxin
LKVLVTMLVLVAAGRAASEPSSQAERGRLHGTIRTEDGVALGDIEVRCFYLSVTGIPYEFGRRITNDEGRYVFEIPVGSQYWVEVGGKKATTATSKKYVAEPEKDISVEDLTVRPFTATVRGHVTFDNGQPAANLDYGYLSASASPVDAANPPKTADDGAFVIEHLLPDEPYSFWVFVGKSTYRVWKRLDPNVSPIALTLRQEDYTQLPEDWLRGGFTHQAIARDTVCAKNSMIDFALPDLDGKVVSFSDVRAGNNAVIVNITGTWCGGCRLEAPYLAQFYNRYRDKGLNVVSIAFERPSDNDPLGTIRSFKQKYNISYTVLYGGPTDHQHVESVIDGLACFHGYPTTIYIDRMGKVQFMHSGFWINSEPHKRWQLDLMEKHILSILSQPDDSAQR